MKLSRTAFYAIKVMAHAAVNAPPGSEKPLIGHICGEQIAVPVGFLLRIMVGLSRAGLLGSIKGPNGGYRLGKPAADISLLDIVEAAEGKVSPFLDGDGSPIAKRLGEIYAGMVQAERNAMERTKLSDLAKFSAKAPAGRAATRGSDKKPAKARAKSKPRKLAAAS